MHIALASGVLVVASVLAWDSASVAAQQGSGSSARDATPAGNAPRTSWGHPDLQGIWDPTTGTPLERPAEYAGKETLTEAEAQEIERKRFASFDEAGRAGGTGDYGSVWREGSKNGLTRTSLISHPKDGKIPALSPQGQQAAAARAAKRKARGPADSWTDRSLWERCITRGTPRIPNNYNSTWHILQTPTHVIIQQEMIHETRVIPIDGRPHVGGDIRLWNGDSRGRWDGDTLVVETTNFNDGQEFQGFSMRDAKLVETFTRLSADQLDYRFTIDNPAIYSAPWTVSLPMSAGTQYYEYACHEGNYGLPGILSGHRAEETRTAQPRRP